MLRYSVTVLGVFSIVLLGAGLASADVLSVTVDLDDLGIPAGYSSSTGWSYSNGVVIGTAGTGATAPSNRAHSYSGGSWTNLGTLSGNSDARDINSSGRSVGFSHNGTINRAVMWAPGAIAPTDLGGLAGMKTNTASRLFGINSTGNAVGDCAFGAVATIRGCFYTLSTNSMSDLGSLYTTTVKAATANDVNDVGQVVGSYLGASYSHAILWNTDNAGTTTSMLDLGVLPAEGIYTVGFNSVAYGISSSGEYVAGYSQRNGALVQHAAMWEVTTTGGTSTVDSITDLGCLNLTGHVWSVARGVNSDGVAVGYSSTAGNAPANDRAFIYYDGTMYNLNDLIAGNPEYSSYTIMRAYYVSEVVDNSLQITGYMTGSDAAYHAYLLTVTIPEPSTLALLAAGLIGLLAYAWRKRK